MRNLLNITSRAFILYGAIYNYSMGWHAWALLGFLLFSGWPNVFGPANEEQSEAGNYAGGKS